MNLKKKILKNEVILQNSGQSKVLINKIVLNIFLARNNAFHWKNEKKKTNMLKRYQLHKGEEKEKKKKNKIQSIKEIKKT